MGSYRSYMRNDYPQERSSPLVWVLCAVVAGFLLEEFLIMMGARHYLAQNLILSAQALKDFKLWTLLSYALLHDPQNLLHVLFSLLGLYFMGRELLPVLGTKRFLGFCGLSAVVAGLSWAVLHWSEGGLLGASGVISGLFIIYALLYPDRPITVLFLFIPVTLPRTRYLAWAVFFIDLAGLAFLEIPNNASVVAHSAHLGGMLAGFLYFHVALGNRSWHFRFPWRRSKPEVIAPAWVGKVGQQNAATPAFHLNLTEREHLKVEVDRILDKINSQGFGSLTPAEKKTLDEARDMLSKH